jgi:predicted CXXCH cytochrome family protein
MGIRLIPKLVLFLGMLCLVASAIGGVGHDTETAECLNCHSDPADEPFGHFIESSDDCIFCHEVASDGTTMGSITDDVICRVCHVANSEMVESGAHVNLSCMECHDPHSTPNPTMFRTAETNLCSGSCHGEHDIGVSHPIGEQVLDKRLGTAMSCVSTCHSMHQPREPKMLQMAALDLCASCHGDKF